MKSLTTAIKQNKQLRIIGFDDAPFNHTRGSLVNIAGIVCSGTKMEGMLWCEAQKDGTDATNAIINALKPSKFYQQIHAVLIDGIAIGGFNVIDLNKLSQELNLPCISVMRKEPDLSAIETALNNFEDGKERWQLIKDAGEIYYHENIQTKITSKFYYQVSGCTPDIAAKVLERTTENSSIPEALRLAHLIGAAIKTGQSSNSA